MSMKMDPGRLSKEELAYELRIRGLEIVGPMEQMRSTLRRLLKLERSGDSLTYPEYNLDCAQEMEEVEAKVTEIEDLIKTLTTDEDSGPYKKIVSKISHVLMRTDRIKATDDADKKHRSDLLIKILGLQTRLEDRLKEIRQGDDVPLLGVTHLSMHSTSDSDSDDDLIRNRAVGSHSTALPVTNSTVKSIPVLKWNVTFSGKPKEMSVLAFIERIEELSRARHVSSQTLFESAADLFTDHARVWFRANHHKFSDWNSLCKGLKAQFLERNHDEKLFQQIKERKQREDEPVGIYFAYMKNAFSRLAVQISELTQVNILRENLKPFFQTALVRDEPRSLDDLEELCLKLEKRCASIDSFALAPVRKWTIEPDLMYMDSQPSTSSCSSTVSLPSRPRNSNSVICWNCNLQGHTGRQCRKPRRRYCFKCGTPNVTKHNCPKCNVASSGNDAASH